MRPLLPVAVLALLGALTACSGDPEPVYADPSPEPSSETEAVGPSATDPAGSTPTARPTESGPSQSPPEPMPPAETVRAWVEAYNTLLRRGDPRPVRALSTPRCRTCELQIRPVLDVISEGGRFETRGWTVAGASPRDGFDRTGEVSVALLIAGGRTFTSSNDPPVRYQRERRAAIFSLDATSNGTWQVARLVYLS